MTVGTGLRTGLYFEDLLRRANRLFALDHGPQLAALLKGLAQPGTLPALFHCTYGKDRTGFGAALVLELMRVPWEKIEQDYLLSNFGVTDGTLEQLRGALLE